MKKINFNTPVSPSEKKEVRRWMLISIILIGGTIVLIGASLFSLWYQYRSVAHQRTALFENEQIYQTQIQKQKKQDKLFTEQSKKETKLKAYTTHPKNPLALLESCVDRIGKNALQSCSITPERIEITYQSITPQHAHKTLQACESLPGISDMELVSLQRQNTNILSTIRGARKRPEKMNKK